MAIPFYHLSPPSLQCCFPQKRLQRRHLWQLLHRRLDHMGKTSMIKLGKEELVQVLGGGLIRGMGVSRGCELGKPLAKPHPSKDVKYRRQRNLSLCMRTWRDL